MNNELKIKGKKVLITILGFLLILLTIVPASARAADNTFILTVRQVYTTTSGLSNSTFVYRLSPLEPGNPMPEGSTAEGYTFTANGNCSVEIPAFGFNLTGIYSYELFQVVGMEQAGYKYDKRVYTIEAYVNAALDTEIIVLNTDDTKAEEIAFENRYEGNPGVLIPEIVTSGGGGTTGGTTGGATGGVTGGITGGVTGGVTGGSTEEKSTVEGIAEGQVPGVEGPDVLEGPELETGLPEAGEADGGPDKGGASIPKKPVGVPKTGDEMCTELFIALLIAGGVLVIIALAFLIAGRKRNGGDDEAK